MKIFICHAPIADDQMIGIVIMDQLERNGIEIVSRVLYGIPGGENWMREAARLIFDADWFIPLISSNFEESVAARSLLLTALEAHKPILPILIERGGNLPAVLQGYNFVDVTKGVGEATAQIKEVLESHDANATTQKIHFDQEAIERERQHIALERPPDRIFIAYSRAQRSLAKELSDLLAQKGKAVFWDAKIKAGATWRQTIQKALDDATHVIVIWTPDAASSDEVEREVSYALAERKVIVPILSKEIPKLPYHLHGLHYIVLENDLQSIEAALVHAIAQHTQDEDIWQ